MLVSAFTSRRMGEHGEHATTIAGGRRRGAFVPFLGACRGVGHPRVTALLQPRPRRPARPRRYGRAPRLARQKCRAPRVLLGRVTPHPQEAKVYAGLIAASYRAQAG